MVKLTPELIEQCASYTNPVKDREVDFRGYKIPVIENLGATLDQFDTMDFSDNEIRKLDGFPYLKRLKNLIVNNNKVVRIGENLEETVPNLESIILTNNNMQELGDLDVLSTLKNLTSLSLMGNPVTTKQHYRFYVIHKCPTVRVLDFRRVRDAERAQAKKLFKGKNADKLKASIVKKSKTFTPGAPLAKEFMGTKAEQERIKLAIVNAKSMAEVERLEALLNAGGMLPADKGEHGAEGVIEEMED